MLNIQHDIKDLARFLQASQDPNLAAAREELAREGGLSPITWQGIDMIYDADQIGRRAEPARNFFTNVNALMAEASQHLKYPKVRIPLSDFTLIIKVGGPSSKYAGKVILTDDGQYPNNQWFGSIDSEGIWHRSNRLAPSVVTEINDTLNALNEDPAGFAAAEGARTGSCCFCAHDLTDERSLAVGYGPICADHFGLPWGE